MAVQIFLMPFLLHHLGPSLTGLYYLFMTISNFVAIGIGWLAGAGVFLLASSDARAKAGGPDIEAVHGVVFLAYGLYATAILAGIWLWGFSAGRLWLVDAGEATLDQVRTAAMYLGAYIWISYLHQADLALYTARLEQGWANLYRVIAQLVFVAVLLVRVIDRPRLDGLMLANVAGAVVAAAAARIHLRRSGRLGPFCPRFPDTKLLRRMLLARGRDYFVFGLAQFGLIYGDVLLVGAVLGPEAVSAFLVIWKIPEVAALVLGRISEILSPWFTRLHGGGDRVGTRRLFLRTSRLQHGLGLAAGLAYARFGPGMVERWVGSEFRPEFPWIYGVAGIALFLQVANRHDVVLHYALARLGDIVPAQFLDLGLKLGLTLVLFPTLGVAAPLVAFLAVQIGGLTWVYRNSALRLAETNWGTWTRKVGGWAAVVLAGAALTARMVLGWFPAGEGAGFFVALGLYAAGIVLILGAVEAGLREDGLFRLSVAAREKS